VVPEASSKEINNSNSRLRSRQGSKVRLLQPVLASSKQLAAVQEAEARQAPRDSR
jgi:hypothetical protein